MRARPLGINTMTYSVEIIFWISMGLLIELEFERIPVVNSRRYLCRTVHLITWRAAIEHLHLHLSLHMQHGRTVHEPLELCISR
jgi:hypothetical protein